MIEVKDVTVCAGGRCILNHVSATLAPGKLTVALGPNGAGKTTFLRAMCGEVPLASGSVRLDGICVRIWPCKKLALRRAVMPQHSHLSFLFTVEEVVSFGRIPHEPFSTRAENAKAVREALCATGIEHLAKRLYPTLSGGEQQRVQLARVFAQVGTEPGEGPARYVWLDEPTSGLDLAHQHHMMRVAREMARRGFGVFCVLHDLNLASAYADEVLLFAEGCLAGRGSPSEVLRPELIRSVYGIPVVVTRNPSNGSPLVIAA
jgi:iron complex transport system ATP-binding protein